MRRRRRQRNKKIGRPAAYEKDPTLVPRIVELAKAGMGVGKIAKELGLNKRALQDWRKVDPVLAEALPIQIQFARGNGPINADADADKALDFARDYDATHRKWPDLITVLKAVGLSWSQHKIRKRMSAKYRQLMGSFDYASWELREFGMTAEEVEADRARRAGRKMSATQKAKEFRDRPLPSALLYLL